MCWYMVEMLQEMYDESVALAAIRKIAEQVNLSHQQINRVMAMNDGYFPLLEYERLMDTHLEENNGKFIHVKWRQDVQKHINAMEVTQAETVASGSSV